MSSQTFNLPDVGEGLTEAEIVAWKVAVGDTVGVNQPIVEIETAKSLVELPSPFAGTVESLLAAEGETVPVGDAIISINTAAAETGGASLVGSGPVAESSGRKVRRRYQPQVRTAPETGSPDSLEEERTSSASAALPSRPLAKPPVRKRAKESGINLADVTATGPRGEVTRADLEKHAQGGHAPSNLTAGANGNASPAPKPAAPSAPAAPRSDDEPFWLPSSVLDREERIPVKGVRKATAKAMVESAFSAPHVSIFVDVDASRTMEFVKRLKESRDFAGVKVSPLLILAKAVIWAAARNPQVNATWNDDEITLHRYMNLGIAAATPRGLLVPNIKDAQELSLRELAVALGDLAETARAGKTTPAQMSGGTLTVTNIGALGIDTGTPIINPGEVAIVAFGTIKQKPWVLDGEVIPRWVTTLGGSFDHRVVDGDLSARFMADVAAILEEPALLLD